MVRESIAFVLGVAAGAIGVKLYLDTKYKQQVDEEISAMREAFANKYEQKEEESEDEEEENSNDILNHSAPVRDDAIELKTSYHNIASAYKEVVKDDPNNEPVIISAEEYEEADHKYALESLDYYVDDNIMMSGDEEMTNAEEVLGKDNLEKFKESDEDTIYIKNDLFMIMYEICKA